MASQDSSSSSTKAKTIRKCPRCSDRMSGWERDRHETCNKCRGKDCDFDNRCDTCQVWTPEEMKEYLSHQQSLKRKRLSKKRKRDHNDDNVTMSDSLDFLSFCSRGKGGLVSLG